MSTILWDQVGVRFFEAGVDRGVLYPTSGKGVPWNGLISVDDKSTGDTVTAYYADGVKYLGTPGATEFEATIVAFTYPEEFEVNDGTKEAFDGFGVTQQDRVEFGLSFRTKVGNDVDGLDYGYKLHLVYNALAEPTDKPYTSVADSLEPMSFSWDITTTPVDIPGYRPSGHLVIDSAKLGSFGLAIIESILYGFTADPRLPLPTELFNLPLEQRAIIVIATPDTSLLPSSAKTGDLVFVVSNQEVYSLNGPAADNIRPVIVIATPDITLLPADAYPGDLVYVESTEIIYRLGG